MCWKPAGQPPEVNGKTPDMPNKEHHLTGTAGRETDDRITTPKNGDFVARADKLIREGHAQEAIAVLEADGFTELNRSDAWRVKARAWRQLGDLKRANDALDSALERFSGEPGLLIDKAELRIREGNYADAIRIFNDLKESASGNVEVWLGRGESLLHEGDAVEALACAERVIELDGRSASGYTLRGDSQLRLGRWDEAFAAFAAAAERDMDRFDSSSWSARGDRFRGYAQTDFALRAYERAIEQDPAYTIAFLNAGALCVESGNFDRALKFFERAKEKARPNDARAWLSVGGVHERRREYEKARMAYEQATIIDPQDPETWNSLGNSFSSLKRWDDALLSYEHAIKVSPNYGWPHHNRAIVLLYLRHFDDAIRSIEEAVEIEPHNALFWRRKLWILNAAKRIEDLGDAIDRALAAAGSDTRLRVTAANHLADIGQADRARDLLQNVEPSELSETLRLSVSESLVLIGDHISALTLLRGLDPTQLPAELPVVRSFLLLLADRLSGAERIAEELLVAFWREFGKQLDRFAAMSGESAADKFLWKSTGVQRLLIHCNLPMLDKFLFATLIDLLEAKISPAEIFFFTDLWPTLKEAEATGPAAL
jgi:tetratricopeptide (TPR) repeat protein